MSHYTRLASTAPSNIAYKAGGITGPDTTDPLLEPFLFGVAFYHEPFAPTTGTSYWVTDPDTNEMNMKSFDSPYRIYTDIIQKVPNDI